MRNTQTQRSKEAPMDFEWTNRASVKPVWATPSDADLPRKRMHGELASPNPALATSTVPVFGSNSNVPFLFQSVQSPQTPSNHTWAPPPKFSPEKAFPSSEIEEVKDVDMIEVKREEPRRDAGRAIAMGGLKRIYSRRHKPHSESRRKHPPEGDSDGDDTSEDDSGSKITTHTTSNHYTLNLPSHTAPGPDTPYVLLGYLQFFFNLVLILLFLYLLVQFILTVQRDVEHRVSEYSTEIVQEIAMCALQHKNNLCATNPIPAMVRQCSNWESCMNRDPTVVGRAKVGAELIAEVVNGFVEPISWKTLVFILTSLSFLTVFINALLSLYRTRHQPISAVSQNSHSAYPITPIPPFPPHQYAAIYPPGSPTVWPKSGNDDIQNPTRRRRLEDGAAVKVK